MVARIQWREEKAVQILLGQEKFNPGNVLYM